MPPSNGRALRARLPFNRDGYRRKALDEALKTPISDGTMKHVKRKPERLRPRLAVSPRPRLNRRWRVKRHAAMSTPSISVVYPQRQEEMWMPGRPLPPEAILID